MPGKMQSLKVPEFRTNQEQLPVWWHHHGHKVWLTSITTLPNENRNTALMLSSNAVSLSITQAEWDTEERGWKLSWVVKQSQEEKVTGVALIFSDEDLRAAFSLSEAPTPSHSFWLIEHYGGSAAFQGKFIRYEKFLNIPCPGTGHDGDPNISIELDEEICNKVLSLLD